MKGAAKSRCWIHLTGACVAPGILRRKEKRYWLGRGHEARRRAKTCGEGGRGMDDGVTEGVRSETWDGGSDFGRV